MKKRRSRYQQMEWLMTCTLVGATGLFILYILFATIDLVVPLLSVEHSSLRHRNHS